MKTIYFLAAAVFCNTIGAGIVLLDLAVFGAAAQTVAGLVALVLTAAGAALMVLGKPASA